METPVDTVVAVELTTSGDIDEVLLAAFAEEGVEIRNVSTALVQPATIDPALAHYVIHFLLQGSTNIWATFEGALGMALYQKVSRAVRKVKERRSDASAELSFGQPPLRYVVPDDPAERQLALDAVPDDLRTSTPPSTKWWRHGHGWLTAEEGRHLDGYG
jgi:hypothetical protein